MNLEPIQPHNSRDYSSAPLENGALEIVRFLGILRTDCRGGLITIAERPLLCCVSGFTSQCETQFGSRADTKSSENGPGNIAAAQCADLARSLHERDRSWERFKGARK